MPANIRRAMVPNARRAIGTPTGTCHARAAPPAYCLVRLPARTALRASMRSAARCPAPSPIRCLLARRATATAPVTHR